MSATINEEQLSCVRRWAAAGVDLNGIQKNLQTECGVHLTYMETRFLLLDHGIEIAVEPAPTPAPQEESEPAARPEAEAARVSVTLDDLQLPGTVLSGKASFPGGAHGAWQIDQMGRLGWSELTGSPSPEEMQEFRHELMALLGQG